MWPIRVSSIRQMLDVLVHENGIMKARVHGCRWVRILSMQYQINGLFIFFEKEYRFWLRCDQFCSLVKYRIWLEITYVEAFELKLGNN